MKRSLLWAAASIALYVLACIVPAVATTDEKPLLGWHALLWGWIPPYSFPWSANLVGLLGWLAYLFRRYFAARLLGLIASAVAPLTFIAVAPDGLLVGYYLWQASFMAFARSAYLASRRKKAAGALAEEAPAGPSG